MSQLIHFTPPRRARRRIALDVLTHDLAVLLGAALPKALATFAAT
jgi:hypothetical protein